MASRVLASAPRASRGPHFRSPRHRRDAAVRRPLLDAALRRRRRWPVARYWTTRPDLDTDLRTGVARQEHQTAERLGDIKSLTLVMIGDRDTLAMGTGAHVEQSEFLMRHLPNGTMRVVEGASHGMFWQLPERSAEILLDWTGAR